MCVHTWAFQHDCEQVSQIKAWEKIILMDKVYVSPQRGKIFIHFCQRFHAYCKRWKYGLQGYGIKLSDNHRFYNMKNDAM